ncbi:carboxymuconolactone decarboxylase family protein [Granulosicoccaceae sp. 1_MG-2023]|nr:carboxymuconolactone decarboxylase family protein [Granulosicoccaceae sp. 1_MG-2023]
MKDFPANYQELGAGMEALGQAIPATMQAFGALHAASSEAGALDTKTKELIALGIAITVRCDGCIAFHVHDAMKAGAGKDEIAETISVAVMMGGGPSVVYGSQALEAVKQFEAQGLS